MPHLNWREASVGQKVGPHAELENELKLSVSARQRDELCAKLREVFGPERGELRMDLAREWAVFWKLREGESRLLLAHPEAGAWVATVALEASHAASLLSRLESLQPGGRIEIGRLGGLGAFSNVEVVIEVV